MRGLLKSTFGRRTSTPDWPPPQDVDFVRWTELHIDDAASSPFTIEDVLDHRHDGFTIKGVFTPDELERAMTYGEHADDFHEVGYGRMWPYPVNASWDGDRRQYFDRAERAVPQYERIWGFDIEQRMNEMFRALSGSLEVELAVEDGRKYAPGSFRDMQAGKIGLPAHTGNEFFDMGGDAPLNYLKSVVRYLGSLSWFVMIDPPTEGGELRLYDLTWDERPELRGFDNYQRDDTPFEEIRTAALRPEAGDLVWFRGGDIWHKVAPIGGRRSRVTFGGFMAPLLAGDRLVYWS